MRIFAYYKDKLDANHIAFWVVFLLLSLTTIARLGSKFSLNLATVVLAKSLNQSNTTAYERQQQLGYVSFLLAGSLETGLDFSDTNNSPQMMSALFRGISHFRDKDWYAAAEWFQVAANAEPYPGYQQEILISPWTELQLDGAIKIKGSSEVWRLRSDSRPAEIRTYSDEIGEFICFDRLPERTSAVFVWDRPFTITYHSDVTLYAYIPQGTILIVETVIDSQLQMQLTFPGNGIWSELSFPIDGNFLQLIYVRLVDNTEAQPEQVCEAKIRYFLFHLDEHVK